MPFSINGIDLFVFAVNYMFPASIVIFLVGSAYKLSRFLVVRGKVRPRAPPRRRGWMSKAKGLIITFIDPIIISLKENTIDFVFGLLFLHLLGTIPLLFLLGQHVSFFQHYFKLYGILWPLALPLSPTTSSLAVFTTRIPEEEVIRVSNIWGPLNILLNGDMMSLFVTLAIGYKMADKIMEWRRGVRSIRPWDWTSLLLLLGIVATGFLSAHHYTERSMFLASIMSYRDLLGLHILLADILLLSIPFTNMWHITFSYFYGKLHEFWDLRLRKGVE